MRTAFWDAVFFAFFKTLMQGFIKLLCEKTVIKTIKKQTKTLEKCLKYDRMVVVSGEKWLKCGRKW